MFMSIVLSFIYRYQNYFSDMYIFNGIVFKTSNFFLLSKAYMPSLYTVTFNAILYSIRSNSNCKYKYSIEMETALNQQIENEQNAAFTYLNMAVYFLHPTISYPGVGGYFMKMYEEELSHMKILINYQLIRGGNPVFKLKGVDPINQNITLVEAFNQALETERNVTEQLENIVKTAEATKDYQSADFVTSKFLHEQMYAMNELTQHITNLNRLCDDKDALYQFDSKLSQIYPYSIKT